MPWESIGDVSTGSGQFEDSWNLWSLRLAKRYVELVCGEPPPECTLDIMWHEHELGEYPTLGVWFEYSRPGNYIRHCERALAVFDNAVSWGDLKEHYFDELFREEEQEESVDDSEE